MPRWLLRRRGGHSYTLFLIMLWLLAISTLVLDWKRYVQIEQFEDWINAFDAETPVLLMNIDDVLSTIVIIVANSLMRIVAESGILYSTGVLMTGISLVVSIELDDATTPPGVKAMWTDATILAYSQALLTPLAPQSQTHQCIAPTLIALRVVTQTPKTDANETKPVSHLTFRTSSPRSWIFDLMTTAFVTSLGLGRKDDQLPITCHTELTVAEEHAGGANVDNEGHPDKAGGTVLQSMT
ncbi:hypothetical protein D9619_013524 [Psilocybe cf. subviscida]|uniref:Uncharacterized protein n=1 Tax=Psilocybe cf. subviscida TaxID=2480587 RepID=A0A8H5BH14_9AGAR|nr:hypothetical protein D9619_013524 [Psilocybe cf. subviscida]